MTANTIILCLAAVGGLYMAWNIGANDVANSMGTSVGSGALTFKQAVFLAAIANFLGAVLVGGHVTDTVRKGIISPEVLGDPDIFVAGMLAALIGAAIWLNTATYFGLPVSTTHSIVGGVFGFGLIYGGFGSVNWANLGSIAASWVISPLAGGVLGYAVFKVIQKRVFNTPAPAASALKVAPPMLFMVVMILVLAIIYKGLKNLHLNLSFTTSIAIAACLGAAVALAYSLYLRRSWGGCEGLSYSEQVKRVERLFAVIQVVTACYVAFAHGANDVANAIGPLAGIYAAIEHKAVTAQVQVPIWMLATGGIGIAVGLATYGYRVLATIAGKITEMTPTRGFSAEFACATTVLVCSRLGLPISTTHTLVGAVVGVGFARGISTLDRKVVTNIVYSWIITIPAASILTIILFQLISRL